MSEGPIAVLPDRAIVAVTGEDAAKLLQGIVTNDMDLLDRQPAIFAGLLSPQGKIQFEFFVVRAGEGYLIDVADHRAEDLVKRLAMYRLRAKADIADITSQMSVLVAWPGGDAIANSAQTIEFADPRCPDLGSRCLEPVGTVDMLLQASTLKPTPASSYHAHRIALGIPEGGKDFDFGDAFPHEANFDINHGVSFTKGCYVGQEIVARMQHRGTARKRIVRITGTSDFSTDRADIKSGDVVIGRLGSITGNRGLALIRLDRVIEAQDKGLPLTAAGSPIEVDAEMLQRWRASTAHASPGQPT